MPNRIAASADRRRLRAMGVFVATAFSALLARSAYLQGPRGAGHAARIRDLKVARVILDPPRGTIRDGRGRVLAESQAAYQVTVVPGQLGPDPGPGIGRLAEALGLTAEETSRLRARVAGAGPAGASRPILVKRDVPAGTARELARKGPSWARVERRDTRAYPFGPLAVHAVGYLNEIGPEELTARRAAGYRAGDRVGRTGVERAFNRALRGAPGHADEPRTRWARVEAPDRHEVAPVAGRDLTLSLDIGLEQAIDESFNRNAPAPGAAVVLEVTTGRVLAHYSRPSYDPGAASLGGTAPDDGPDAELDRALMVPRPPGAVLEPFLALSILRAHAPEPVTCAGSYLAPARACSAKHGKVDLERALAEGCDVFFYQRAAGLADCSFVKQTCAGVFALAEVAGELGLDRPTGIGVGREATGWLPTRAAFLRSEYGPGPVAAVDFATGQGPAVAVTPMALAVAYAALATGGAVYRPQLALRTEGPGGEAFPPELVRQVALPAADLARVRAGLRAAVTSDAGVAHALASAAVPVAGIVGVARRPGNAEGPTDAWFAGYAPAEAPQVAIVVLAGGAGSARAAAIAADLVRAYAAGEAR